MKTVTDALREAYELGKIYWQQADSEYPSDWKKTMMTHEKFNDLLREFHQPEKVKPIDWNYIVQKALDESVEDHVPDENPVVDSLSPNRPDQVERVLKFAGKQRREVSNPCLSARDTIVIANWIQRTLKDITWWYNEGMEQERQACIDTLESFANKESATLDELLNAIRSRSEG